MRVKFVVSGRFPGDGKPKDVAFPNPGNVVREIGDFSCVDLQALVEWKLASGTLPDLAGVQELIRCLKLSAKFASQLNESVRDAYEQLWAEVQDVPPEV